MVEIGEGRYRLSARLGLDEVADLFDMEFPDEITEEVETLGGLLALELGRVPLPGARVVSTGLDLRAEGGHDRRGRVKVVTVVAERAAVERSGDDDDDNADEENR